mgnify:FL=1
MPRATAFALLLGVSRAALAGPNIIAIGNYDAIPFKRAEGRDSFSGKEIVYSFDDPQFDFGRVVVRSKQPNSIVRRDLFVGFSGGDLRVSTKPSGQSGTAVQIDEVEIWLKIAGALRSGGTYEWETNFVEGERRVIEGGVPAIIPAFWADGQPIGVDVSITEPEPEDTDRIQRLLLPRGTVKIPNFERQTGAAWVVLKPRNFGSDFGIPRFSFREADQVLTTEAAATMPTPVRYVSIRNQVEDQIAEVLDRGEKALKQLQNPEHFWGSGNELEGNVAATAAIANALAELDPKDEAVREAMKWLAAQEPPRGSAFSVATVSSRLTCLGRHGSMTDFGPTIQRDAQFLVDAQLEDVGWADRSPKSSAGDVTAVNSEHNSSLAALVALREARFAGAVIDNRVWRNAMRYWTDAQTYDGGFSHRLARYGSISQPTVAFTATGAAGLLISLDMASGIGSKRCSTYLASKEQLRAIDKALKWLDERYKKELRSFGSFLAQEDPYVEPDRLETLGEVSGLSHFNEKNHFIESAEALLANYDQNTGMFGIRGQAGGLGIQPGAFAEAPSPRRTAWALSTLGAGNAPTVVQRIIAGDDENGWAQYRGDVPHLVRYLAAKSGRPFNWRRTSIDREVRELVEVPILLLSVVGAFNWSETEWSKIREYCLAGGTLVVDIGEEAEGQRAVVETGLQRAFPEYKLAELPADAAVFAVDKSRRAGIAGIKAMGNGFRHFAFLPPRSWSCAWHTYDTKEHENAFTFMQDLLNCATDDTPPRSSFARSTYAAAAASSRSMKATRIQVGGALPAYPNLIATMDRLMESNYRTRIEEAKSPSEADLVWVNVAGADAPSEEVRKQLLEVMRGGGSPDQGGRAIVLIDVVGGNTDWDEGFRAVLAGLDSGIVIEKLRRNDAVFTGEIAGTQGFDVVDVPLRKALHTRFAKSGRCDLYAIYLKGRPVGIYSAYDLSSGIGYHYFPGCRGVMPEQAREIAMNVFLSAYAGKAAAESRADARSKG